MNLVAVPMNKENQDTVAELPCALPLVFLTPDQDKPLLPLLKPLISAKCSHKMPQINIALYLLLVKLN